MKDKNFDKISSFKTELYQEFMKKMFNKSFLDEKKKLQKTFASMKSQKIDIFFAQ